MKFTQQLIFCSFVLWILFVTVYAGSRPNKGADCSCISPELKKTCTKQFSMCRFSTSKGSCPGCQKRKICCPRACDKSYRPVCAVNKNRKCRTFSNPCTYLAERCKNKKAKWQFLTCNECPC